MHRCQVPIELSKAFTPHHECIRSLVFSRRVLSSHYRSACKSHQSTSAQDSNPQLPVVSPEIYLQVPSQVSHILGCWPFFAVSTQKYHKVGGKWLKDV